ncbi:MAG: GAF domain-containing protein, partial [Calditrichaeota bacterium]
LITSIKSITSILTSPFDFENKYSQIYKEISKLLPMDGMFLGLYLKENSLLHLIFIMNENQRFPEVTIPVESRIEKEALTKRRPVLKNNIKQSLNYLNNNHKVVRSTLAAPLIYRDQVIGLVSLQNYTSNVYLETHLEFLSLISGFITLDVINFILTKAREIEKNALKQLQKVSHELTQPLTGITGYCNLIREEISKDDPFFREISDMEEQALRLEKLIQKVQMTVHLNHSEIAKNNPYLNLLKILQLDE